MKIRFLTSIAAERWSFYRGQVIDVPEMTPQLHAILRSGNAEVVHEEPELATVAAPEEAMRPSGRRRG